MLNAKNKKELYKELLPPEINKEPKTAADSLLPKSKEKYIVAYDNFMIWKYNKYANSLSENVFLAYFNELAKKYKPSSLWCTYSMLKSTVRIKNGINIKTYSNLTAFLKTCSTGFRSTKSKVLSANDVEKFLKEAPDRQYLATKVALIFGITGACRRQELCNITTNDVEHHGKMLLVKIANAKNKIPRSFTIHGPFYDIVKKYEALRMEKAKSDRFFQNFQKGRCTSQPIGINKFGCMPREIATYLGLPNADSYTGHSFRRTSVTMQADSRLDKLRLKCRTEWGSNTFEESNVEGSVQSDAEDSSQSETEDLILNETEDLIQNQTADSIQNETENLIQNQTADTIQNETENSIQNVTKIITETTHSIDFEPIEDKYCPFPEPSPSPPIPSTPIPSIHTPSIQTPSIHTPSIQTPSTQTPSTQTPSTQTPSRSYINVVLPTPDDVPYNENGSSSPTSSQDPITETVHNTLSQTVRMPTKTIVYTFKNCTFTNCFNN